MQVIEKECPHKDENGECRKQPGMRCYVAWYPDCKVFRDEAGEDMR